MTEPLLAFVRGTAPATTAELWRELTLAGQRKLLRLCLEGRLKQDGERWVVVYGEVRERMLFS